jgi:hypothetical protein
MKVAARIRFRPGTVIGRRGELRGLAQAPGADQRSVLEPTIPPNEIPMIVLVRCSALDAP